MSVKLTELLDIPKKYIRRFNKVLVNKIYNKELDSYCYSVINYSTTANGYPRWKSTISNKMSPISRDIWRVINGPIPESQIITRACGNKLCCNPEHMSIKQRTDIGEA